MYVSIEILKSLNACEDQVTLFRSTFGNGVEVTKENLSRAFEAGLDLNWWGRQVFGEAHREVVALALKAYGEAKAPAWKAYGEANALAWKAYNEAVASVSEASDEAKALALKTYDETNALATKLYHEAEALAWKAYVEALIESLYSLSLSK